MGDEQRARERFSRDMRRLREDQGLSIKEVYDETRIAQTLIESFEEGRLYDHPNYNRVYLRSFVRAYGECVGISSERALSALDAALDGTYEGGLGSKATEDAVEEASESPASSPEDERGSDSDEGSEPPTAQEEERADVDASEDEDEEGAESEETRDESSEEELSEEELPSPPTSASPSESATDADDESASEDESGPSEEHPLRMDKRTADTEGEPASLDSGGTGVVGDPKTVGGSSGDPSSMPPRGPVGGSSTPSRPSVGRRSRDRSRWKRLLRSNRREILFAGIGIVIVSLVLAGLGFAYFSRTQVKEQETATVVPDTTVDEAAAVDTTSEVSEPSAPPADVTLGDQVHVMIQGTQPVTEIRIQRDQDLRRPYWIEEGDAAVFPFEQRITLEEELENIRLFVEGYPYPTDVRDPLNRIEITRDQAEEFVDTLRGSPASLSVTPDTIPAGNPLNFE